MTIPDDMVKETRAELCHDHRDDSFRNRLLEFVGLYKFVVDSLVKRKAVHAVARSKVNHTYMQLTPEDARGAKVTFNVRGKAETFMSPAFKKTSIMINNEYLAVILLMNFKRNPFFLWLLRLFARGALAPKAADDPEAPGASAIPLSKNKKGKKRHRGSPASPPRARDDGTDRGPAGRGGRNGLPAAARSGKTSGDGSGAASGGGTTGRGGSDGGRPSTGGGDSQGTGTGKGNSAGGGTPGSGMGGEGPGSDGLGGAGIGGAGLGAPRVVGGGACGGGADNAAESTLCTGDEAKALVERVDAGTLLIDG